MFTSLRSKASSHNLAGEQSSFGACREIIDRCLSSSSSPVSEAGKIALSREKRDFETDAGVSDRVESPGEEGVPESNANILGRVERASRGKSLIKCQPQSDYLVASALLFCDLLTGCDIAFAIYMLLVRQPRMLAEGWIDKLRQSMKK